MAFLAGGSSHPAVLEAAGRVAALQLRLSAIRRNKVEVFSRFAKMAAKPSTAVEGTGHEADKVIAPIRVHGIPPKNRRRRKAEVRIKARELKARIRAHINEFARPMKEMPNLDANPQAMTSHTSQDTQDGPHDTIMDDAHDGLSSAEPPDASPGSAEDRVDPVYNGSSEHDERIWIFDELQNLDEYERKILSKRRKAGFALLRAFESAS